MREWLEREWFMLRWSTQPEGSSGRDTLVYNLAAGTRRQWKIDFLVENFRPIHMSVPATEWALDYLTPLIESPEKPELSYLLSGLVDLGDERASELIIRKALHHPDDHLVWPAHVNSCFRHPRIFE